MNPHVTAGIAIGIGLVVLGVAWRLRRRKRKPLTYTNTATTWAFGDQRPLTGEEHERVRGIVERSRQRSQTQAAVDRVRPPLRVPPPPPPAKKARDPWDDDEPTVYRPSDDTFDALRAIEQAAHESPVEHHDVSRHHEPDFEGGGGGSGGGGASASWDDGPSIDTDTSSGGDEP